MLQSIFEKKKRQSMKKIYFKILSAFLFTLGIFLQLCACECLNACLLKCRAQITQWRTGYESIRSLNPELRTPSVFGYWGNLHEAPPIVPTPRAQPPTPAPSAASPLIAPKVTGTDEKK